jgi:hypothetical protein
MKWEQIDITRYRESVQAGAAAEEVLVNVLSDGVGEVNAIRLVRELFSLDIIRAKELLVRVQGDAKTLSEHQVTLLPALQKALDAVEDDDKK